MRLGATLCVCIFLSLQITALAAQQQTAKATLQGVVKNATTGEPIAGVAVTLTNESTPRPAEPVSAGSPTAIEPATTNGNGEFVFSSLDPGSYRLRATKDSYAREDYARRIVLTTGASITGVVVRMTPAGTVSGRIRGLTGQPVSGVAISLLRQVYSSNGTSALSLMTSARTNDRGEYRMFWVTPGRYYVVAAGNIGPSFLADSLSEPVSRGIVEARESYAQTFYPGVRDLDKASPIDLPSGGELLGIDFTIERQSLHRIRGRVIDANTGKAPPQASIFYSGRRLVGSFGSSGPRYNPATGVFEILDLLPGRYAITVTTDGQTNTGNWLPGIRMAFGAASIENSDVDNLVLTVDTQPIIAVKVRVEGQIPEPSAIDSLRIGLTRGDTLSTPFWSTPRAQPTADGTLALNSVPDGTFRVSVSNLPAGFYVKGAQLNGDDVLGALSTFSSAGNLAITISSDAGLVDGHVLDAQGRPVSGIETVLIPNGSRNRPELFIRATTDQDGRFSIPGVAPGDYKVFAWENLHAFSYHDPEVLKKFEMKGTSVHVEGSSQQTVTVKMILEGGQE